MGINIDRISLCLIVLLLSSAFGYPIEHGADYGVLAHEQHSGESLGLPNGSPDFDYTGKTPPLCFQLPLNQDLTFYKNTTFSSIQLTAHWSLENKQYTELLI